MRMIDNLNQQIGEVPTAILICTISVLVVLILTHHFTHTLKKRFAEAGMPSLSLVLNIIRIMLWVTLAFFLGENVFHIEMGGLVSALGVTSLIVSLGLQDLIKSIVAGILIVMGDIVSVGDQVILGDHRGEVMDINWHQITIRDRDGVAHIISNSELMGGTFMRLKGKMACRHMFDIDIVPGANLPLVKTDIETLASNVLSKNGWIAEGYSAQVLFLSASALGTQASVRLFISDIEFATRAMDAVMCAISERGYLANVTGTPDTRWVSTPADQGEQPTTETDS